MRIQNSNYHRTNTNWEERQIKQCRLGVVLSYFRQIWCSIMQECRSSIDSFWPALPYPIASAPPTTPQYGSRQSAESRWLRPRRESRRWGRNWKISRITFSIISHTVHFRYLPQFSQYSDRQSKIGKIQAEEVWNRDENERDQGLEIISKI